MAITFKITQVNVDHDEDTSKMHFNYRVFVDVDGVQHFEWLEQVVDDGDLPTVDHIGYLEALFPGTVDDTLKPPAETL